MTPAARVQAAITVLDEIALGHPAEQVLTNWARRSRFAGSKDRAAIRDHVYDVLRCRRSFAALGGGHSGRALMLGALRAAGTDPDTVFGDGAYGPEALSEAERSAGRAPTPAEALDLPDWLTERFEVSVGAQADGQARLLRARAPVSVRVNLRKGSVSEAQSALASDGVTATPNPVADTGLLLVEGARKLAQSRAYLAGMVELQDAASQAAMAGLPLAPGARVLDFCAGGGGKVLALAARYDAEWFAHDADPRRMGDLPVRAARAGVPVVRLERRELSARGPFDVIVADVPCSGSGTWRRTPMAKWTLSADSLAGLMRTQSEILRDVQAWLKPGGLLVYTTCSLLSEENEDRVTEAVNAGGLRLEAQHRWPVSEFSDAFFRAILRRT